MRLGVGAAVGGVLRIGVIAANNQQRPQPSFQLNSYYFSIYSHCWGWPTWRSAVALIAWVRAPRSKLALLRSTASCWLSKPQRSCNPITY
jgi:hypothetical protein